MCKEKRCKQGKPKKYFFRKVKSIVNIVCYCVFVIIVCYRLINKGNAFKIINCSIFQIRANFKNLSNNN